MTRSDKPGEPRLGSPEIPRPNGTPARTPPLPESDFIGWTAGPHAITAFREYNAVDSQEWEMPRHWKQAVLGASAETCNIVIPDRGLSATHVRFERRATKLRIYDEHSTNGTYVRNYRIDVADLDPGDLFTPRPITLVAMNDQMRQHRPLLVDIMGAGFARSPDWMMVEAATSSGPLLIVGEPGSDMEQLARSIHAISPRRDSELVSVDTMPANRAIGIELVKQAHKSTLVLTLSANPKPLNAAFVEMLFSPTYGVRPIVVAHREQDARTALGEGPLQVTQHVQLRPLAYRAGDIPHLLDRMFQVRNADHLRVADMKQENQDALRTYDWPNNFDSLREMADAIVAYVASGGLRGAAKTLGRGGHSSLSRFFKARGMTLPLFPRDEHASRELG
jgi:hypothetical protein